MGKALSRHEIGQVESVLTDFHDTLLATSEFVAEQVMQVVSDWNDGEIREDDIPSELGVSHNRLNWFSSFADKQWNEAKSSAEEEANKKLSQHLTGYGIDYKFMFQLDGLGQQGNILVPTTAPLSTQEDASDVLDIIVPYWEDALDDYRLWVKSFVTNIRDAYDAHQDNILSQM